MRHAKIFSIFVLIATLGYGAVGFYFLPLATFQGDLTRMSLLPESKFGWRRLQPNIDLKLIQQSSLQEADVLVIGDSFSDSLVWQTGLIKHGLKVRTERWKNIRGICTDFMPWLHEQGFKGKFLIFETVERSLLGNLNDSLTCNQFQYHPRLKTDAPHHPPIVTFDVNHGDYAGKLSTGIRTQLNIFKYERWSRANNLKTLSLPNDVKLKRVTNGCALFSHESCNDALFLGEDKADDIDESAMKNIGIINSRLHGITPIWVIVPNKSTTYLYPEKQFWNKAEGRIHAPNLLHMTQDAIKKKVVDLYPGNNTHFSTTGYLLMGEIIFKAMQQTQPSKSQEAPNYSTHISSI